MSRDVNPRSNEAIAERLRLLREAMELTQTELTLRVGVHQPTYHAYEAARRRPSLNDAIKLKMSLGVPTDWLYFGEEIGMPDRLISQIRTYAANRK